MITSVAPSRLPNPGVQRTKVVGEELRGEMQLSEGRNKTTAKAILKR
jgi:hypothetical protein